MKREQNTVLIGMPGVGKSTVGVLLAKATGRDFIDTDVYIQLGQERSLQEMLDADGIASFCRIEEQYILCLEASATVIATGGSVVYSQPAMERLRAGGLIVHLDIPLEILNRRLGDLQVRGVVIGQGQTLDSLYAQRRPLYQRWAQLTIDCQNLSQDQVVAEILERMP